MNIEQSILENFSKIFSIPISVSPVPQANTCYLYLKIDSVQARSNGGLQAKGTINLNTSFESVYRGWLVEKTSKFGFRGTGATSFWFSEIETHSEIFITSNTIASLEFTFKKDIERGFYKANLNNVNINIEEIVA